MILSAGSESRCEETGFSVISLCEVIRGGAVVLDGSAAHRERRGLGALFSSDDDSERGRNEERKQEGGDGGGELHRGRVRRVLSSTGVFKSKPAVKMEKDKSEKKQTPLKLKPHFRRLARSRCRCAVLLNAGALPLHFSFVRNKSRRLVPRISPLFFLTREISLQWTRNVSDSRESDGGDRFDDDRSRIAQITFSIIPACQLPPRLRSHSLRSPSLQPLHHSVLHPRARYHPHPLSASVESRWQSPDLLLPIARRLHSRMSDRTLRSAPRSVAVA